MDILKVQSRLPSTVEYGWPASMGAEQKLAQEPSGSPSSNTPFMPCAPPAAARTVELVAVDGASFAAANGAVTDACTPEPDLDA